jgi:cyanate lyase
MDMSNIIGKEARKLTIEEKVHDYIKANGLKFRHIAAKVGIKETTFAGMVNGYQRMPLEVFAKVCLALKIDPKDFLYDQVGNEGE